MLPLVILVLVACLEVAGMARVRIQVVGAAREGARVAATAPDPAQAAGAVRAALGEPLGSAARITVERPAVVGRPAVVEVVVIHRLASPVLDRVEIALTGRATMRVER